MVVDRMRLVATLVFRQSIGLRKLTLILGFNAEGNRVREELKLLEPRSNREKGGLIR